MNIRPAHAGDAKAIAQIHVQCWQETYDGIMPQAYLAALSVEQRYQMWLDILAEGQPVFVAEEQGQIMGFGSGGRHGSEIENAKGELFALYVLKSKQGNGVGAALFVEVREVLANKNWTPFVTWVVKENLAKLFYEKMGGELVTQRQDEVGGQTLTELCYRFN